MAPSLFSNEYSRGPLYQYWKERGDEEKALRARRIQEAKLRSKGIQLMDSTYGPSSNDQYTSRATSGPPAYSPDNPDYVADTVGTTTRGLERDRESRAVPGIPQSTTSPVESEPHAEPLPSYHMVVGGGATSQTQEQPTLPSPSTSGAPCHTGSLSLSAEEEKARLQQRQQIEDDAAIAQTLSNDDDAHSEGHSLNGSDNAQPETLRSNNDGTQAGPSQRKRKITAGKIGRWLADAASGYTKKQERW
ncbi:hypothetical protein ABEF95_016425 [Exophiala dermatitidis]